MYHPFLPLALVEVAPTSADIAGGTLITITASEFPAGSSYVCDFGGTTSVASYVDGTTVTCIAPTVGSSGMIDLTVTLGGKSYGQALAFEYYACGEATSCGDCLGDGDRQCAWCLESATCSQTCGSELAADPECPTIFAVAPNEVSVSGGRPLSVYGGVFFDSDQWECAFGTETTPATFESSGLITCESPVYPVSEPRNTFFSLLYEGQPYTDVQIEFNFFACDGIERCATCTESAECKWCDGTCATTGDSCTASQQCLGITGQSPTSFETQPDS